MSFYSTVFRTVASAFSLFVLCKIMGRKQIGQLNIFDYVVGITIGSIAAVMSTDKEISCETCIIAMGVLALIEVLISLATTKSIKLRRILTGTPIVLIEEGKIIEDGLNKARFDVNDLLQECRSNGHFDISKIQYALMEANGRLSFLLKSKYDSITPSDMKLKVSNQGLCANLIIDGNIMHENLKKIGKDKTWLLARLKTEKIDDYRKILLLSCDINKKFSIYFKSVPLKKSHIIE